jgi:ABC-2 type transport system permease protein
VSVRTVARKDVADAGRSRALWAVTGVVVLLTAGLTALIGMSGSPPAADVFGLAIQLGTATLPLVALVLAKGAITGERESGSMRVLLSLPPSRRDVLVGKVLGRTALMLVATLVSAVATSVVVFTLLSGGLELVAPLVGSLGLMGVAFVAVGVGISAAASTDGRATAGAVAVYVFLVALWPMVQTGLRAGAVELGLMEAGSQPAWLEVVKLLPPNRAAKGLYDGVTVGQPLAADPFVSAWFPALLLLGWLVVPVAVGYRQFRRADIG